MIYLFIISVIIVVIIIIAIYLFCSYKRLIKLHNLIKDEYLVISIMLKKRNDLIPKLIEITKEYSNCGKKLLDEIVEVRNDIIDTNIMEEIIYYDYELSNDIGKLLKRLEKNKDLSNDNDYINIKQELISIENNLEEERKKYNEIVLKFNKQVYNFPRKVISEKLNYQKEKYFKSGKMERS